MHQDNTQFNNPVDDRNRQNGKNNMEFGFLALGPLLLWHRTTFRDAIDSVIVFGALFVSLQVDFMKILLLVAMLVGVNKSSPGIFHCTVLLTLVFQVDLIAGFSCGTLASLLYQTSFLDVFEKNLFVIFFAIINYHTCDESGSCLNEPILFVSARLTHSLILLAASSKMLFDTTPLSKLMISILSIVVAMLCIIVPHDAIAGQTVPIWILRFMVSDISIMFLCGYWIAMIVAGAWFAGYAGEVLKWDRVVVRKVFHYLAVVMFAPSFLARKLNRFTALAFVVVLLLFMFLEYLRIFAFQNSNLGAVKALNKYLLQFTSAKEIRERKGVILSHITLLFGIAYPFLLSEWLKLHGTRFPLLPYIGLVTVGIGDATAAIAGSLFGRKRWPSSERTYLGSAAGFVSMWLSGVLFEVLAGGAVGWTEALVTGICMLATALLEALTTANDNLLLPVYCSGLYIALKRSSEWMFNGI